MPSPGADDPPPIASFSSTQRTTIVATGLGVFMIFLDALIVNVALPDIQSALGTGESGLQWVVTAYSIGMAALMMGSATVADRIGRRRAYVAGIGVFAAASLTCGLAPDLGVLVAARGVQGMAAALVNVTSLALVSNAFDDRRSRVRAIGLWTAVGAVGTSLGPTLGGVLTEGIGWRAVFFVNVPVAVLAVVLTSRAVRESRDPSVPAADLPGQALFVAAVGGLAFAVIEGQHRGWTSAPILGAGALFVVALATFVAHELRTPRPMMDLRLFARRTYRLGIVAIFVAFFSAYGMMLVVTQYLQNVDGRSPVATGAIVLPFSLAMLLVSPRAGRLAARLGSRAPVLAGQCAQVLGLVGIAAGMAVGPIPVAIGVGVLGVGIALLSTPLTAVAMTAVPAERAGMASGIMSTQRAVGSTVGYAVLGAVLATWLGATLDADLAPVLRDPEQRTAVAEAVLDDATPAAYAAEIGPGRPIAAASGTERDAIRAAVDDDFVHGIQAGLGVAAVLALLVLVALVRGFPGRDREAAATTGADPPAEDR